MAADGALPTDVLVTIRSRCRPVQLPVPAIADVAAKLAADGVEDALARHAATLAQGDAEVATRLAHDPTALQRRETLPLLIMNIRSISSAYAAADRLITLAEQDAAEAAAARDEKERAELLAILGITEGARISPACARRCGDWRTSRNGVRSASNQIHCCDR